MAITNEDSIIEALIVGLLTVIVGIVVSSLVKHVNDSTCDPVKHDCRGKNVYYFVFFLTGVVIYYFCELAGINDTYCQKKMGSVCAGPLDNMNKSIVRFTTVQKPFANTPPSSLIFVRGNSFNNNSPNEAATTSPIRSINDEGYSAMHPAMHPSMHGNHPAMKHLLDLFDHSEQSSPWDNSFVPTLVEKPPPQKSFFKMFF